MRGTASKFVWLVPGIVLPILILSAVTVIAAVGCGGEETGACVVGASCTSDVTSFTCGLQNGDFHQDQSCAQVAPASHRH